MLQNSDHIVSGAASVSAVILQLGNDGDQILEAKDETTVLTLMHHAVLSIVPAGGMSKVNHANIHRGAAGLPCAVGGATAATVTAPSGHTSAATS